MSFRNTQEAAPRPKSSQLFSHPMLPDKGFMDQNYPRINEMAQISHGMMHNYSSR